MNAKSLIATTLLLAAPLAAHGGHPTAPLASASIAKADGNPAGIAEIRANGHGSAGGLVLHVYVTGMPPGVHGMHIHAVGKCEGPAFASAGGHLNPDGHMHGMYNLKGPHLGDLPNLVVDAAGNSDVTVPLHGDRERLMGALFGPEGSSLVIHAKVDDYQTDPSGNSGARIACGVLRKG